MGEGREGKCAMGYGKEYIQNAVVTVKKNNRTVSFYMKLTVLMYTLHYKY